MLSYIITYGVMLFYFSLFFIAVITGFKNGSGQLKDVLAGKAEPGILFIRMIAGIFFLGIGTAALFAKRNLDVKILSLTWSDYNASLWILIVAAMIIGTSSALKKISPANNTDHSLPPSLPLSFVFIRTLFLIVYEFFFRGVVLFIMIDDLGVTAAVIINLILYTSVHWFNTKERYGSVPMGVILCSVSIHYYSVWPAVIIHLSLALSNEITLLINNKSLIKKSWS